jgi:hypothetical protein
MDLIELTDAEVKNLCSNVTPAIREFCVAHMNWATWPEIWVQSNTRKDPNESLEAAPPFTEAQWWEIINERVVTPGEPSSDAAQ